MQTQIRQANVVCMTDSHKRTNSWSNPFHSLPSGRSWKHVLIRLLLQVITFPGSERLCYSEDVQTSHSDVLRITKLIVSWWKIVCTILAQRLMTFSWNTSLVSCGMRISDGQGELSHEHGCFLATRWRKYMCNGIELFWSFCKASAELNKWRSAGKQYEALWWTRWRS